MSVRETILSEMQTIATEQNKTLGPLSDDASLLTCGLESLGFAVLVARLEEHLGVDPFATDDDIALPVTVGEFVRFYERSLA